MKNKAKTHVLFVFLTVIDNNFYIRLIRISVKIYSILIEIII